MAPDAMTVRLHVRRIRVIAVVADLVEKLVVEIADTRRVVRCPHCGFKTPRVHDRRRLRVADLPTRGRPTTLVWIRRRFSCDECSERSWEEHPEIIIGRRTHITRRLARQLVRDVNHLSIREISRRYDLPWHYIMALVGGWSDLVVAARRRRRCRILMVDETSLRRGHRYVTVLLDGETGGDARALSTFLTAQGHRWCRGVKVVVTDGSSSYRAAIRQHLGHATHVVDRFHVTRWFAAGLIEVRRRVQRIAPQGSRPAFDPDIFRSRYLQLTRLDRLDVERIENLGKVLARDPRLEVAWRMLQHLYGIYLAEDSDEANQALAAFIEAHQEHPLPEFDKIISALLDWGDEIFAFHDTDRASNGRLEGTNNKLGALKRIAYGFVNSDNFGRRALLQMPAMATSP
ncbi:MAG: ISL3 family transposase [Thermoanaerobaculales bacterium]|nr:ISL3 family transposase [Thermoanaerobaculales bacterium]